MYLLHDYQNMTKKKDAIELNEGGVISYSRANEVSLIMKGEICIVVIYRRLFWVCINAGIQW